VTETAQDKILCRADGISLYRSPTGGIHAAVTIANRFLEAI